MSYATITSTIVVGVYLPAGGTVSNPASASIVRSIGAEIANDPGVVINSGLIAGMDYVVYKAIVESPPAHGVYLPAGGSVTNFASGVIQGGDDGVYIRSLPAAVVNYGAIEGFNASNGNAFFGGVVFTDGGSVTNSASASITDTANWGIRIAGGAGTVSNAGTIAGTNQGGIGLYGGGSISNASSGTIAGGAGNFGIRVHYLPGTVVNSGRIAGGTGVLLEAGGAITNNASASIVGGSEGVYISGAAGTVINSGSIAATVSAEAIGLGAGGTVINNSAAEITGKFRGVNIIGVGVVENFGTIAGIMPSGGDFGVALYPGGSVTNHSGATISGYDGVRGYSGTLTVALTIVNAGSIAAIATSASGRGVDLSGNGSVTNQHAAEISGFDGIYAAGTSVSVVNAGSIAGNPTISPGTGLYLAMGGSVTNQSGAAISGFEGIFGNHAAVTLLNAGSIAGGASLGAHGLYLRSGGLVTNEASASITGYYGILAGIYPGATTVVNDGTIAGTGGSGRGIQLAAGGSVTNAAGALITGGSTGVVISDGTLTSGGTIIGNGGTAVAFGGTGGNLLVLDPGFRMTGVVYGSPSATNTLELASAGTVTDLGVQFSNFAKIVFDPGADWSIGGNIAALAGGEVIRGFTNGDTIDVVGVSETISSFASGTLSLTGTAPLNLLLPGSFTTPQFHAAPSSDGTDITVACFVEGTRVLTEAGEVEVQHLKHGARVVSLSHRTLPPIAWIGHRRLREAWPVRVAAHAFGPGEPHRDLWLSPDHAVHLDEVLVPVRYLINGATIVQEHCDEVCYFHVELAEHGVLLAEGLPVESYLDTGNRAAFSNGGASVHMHPDFAMRVWERQACAKLVVDGPVVVAIRERLHAQAKQLGWTSTAEPAPFLFAGGRQIAPAESTDDRVTFHLPPGCRDARLLSRAIIAAHLYPSSTDYRRLGLAVTALALDGTALTLNDSRLRAGWHAPEPGLRWTDGAAELALAGERTLAVRFVRPLRYWTGSPAGSEVPSATMAQPSRRSRSP